MIERVIKQFILKALLQAKDQPISEDTLRQLVRSAFAHVAITEASLTKYIKELQASGIITGVDDGIVGQVWTLTLSGKLKAQELK